MIVELSWQSLNWEALATFASGVLAVLAASYIGIRQSRISQRQNEILEGQDAAQLDARVQDRLLQTQNFRVTLLKERSDFIDRFRAIHSAYMQNDHLEDDEWRELVRLFQEAQLLYPEDIARDLDRLSTAIMRSKLYRNRADQYFKSGKEDLAQVRLEKAFEEDDTAFETIQTMLDRLVEASRVEIS